jgi:hypothetical protein
LTAAGWFLSRKDVLGGNHLKGICKFGSTAEVSHTDECSSRSDTDTNSILIHDTTGEVIERASTESSYPLPDKETKKQLIRYSYLTMSSNSADNETQLSGLEWQVHPVDNGPLRYELVDPEQKRQDNGDNSIRAIYHHHGFENDLPTSYSHGILLLPFDSSPLLDITVVSSLLVLLSTVRKQSTVQKQSRIRSLITCL